MRSEVLRWRLPQPQGLASRRCVPRFSRLSGTRLSILTLTASSRSEDSDLRRTRRQSTPFAFCDRGQSRVTGVRVEIDDRHRGCWRLAPAFLTSHAYPELSSAFCVRSSQLSALRRRGVRVERRTGVRVENERRTGVRVENESRKRRGWGNRHRRCWLLAPAFLDSHAYPELGSRISRSPRQLVLRTQISEGRAGSPTLSPFAVSDGHCSPLGGSPCHVDPYRACCAVRGPIAPMGCAFVSD